MRPRPTHDDAPAFAVAAHVAALALVFVFWGHAAFRLGSAPAPLDDVFIHFGFARSLALGHPMQWIVGNGFSSGATSLTYPVVLAPAYWLVGREGLIVVAAALSVACSADLLRSLFALTSGAPRWVRCIAPFVVFAVPFVDWNLCSGMESALLAAVLGRSLVALRRAESAPPHRRARAQLHTGVWLAVLVATRPETIALAAPLAVAVAHAGRSFGAAASLARALGPTLCFVSAQAGLYAALTGEFAAAGAVRKLITSNPYASPPEIALEVVKNALVLREQALDTALGGGALAFAAPLLALAAAFDRRTRRLAVALLAGSVGALAIVCLNATARFQNLRYAVPTLLMLLAAAALGASSLSRRGALGRLASTLLLGCLFVAPASGFPHQIDHFVRASRNIQQQQVEVARRLSLRVPRPRRVFVNDAGAIPYLSGLDAIDGLGLGGFRDLPFARASVHGPAAVIELIQRLPPRDRPDVLAVYPGWWSGLVDIFGTRNFSVKIDDNVICGSDEKVVYDADWSLLGAFGDDAPQGVIDEIDVADLVSEEEHAYSFDAPHAGWVVGAVLDLEDGRARWDGGRIVPAGKAERFRVRESVGEGPATLTLRTDSGDAFTLRVSVSHNGSMRGREGPSTVHVPVRAAGTWHLVEVEAPSLKGGDVVEMRAVDGTWRDFHVWMTRR